METKSNGDSHRLEGHLLSIIQELEHESLSSLPKGFLHFRVFNEIFLKTLCSLGQKYKEEINFGSWKDVEELLIKLHLRGFIKYRKRYYYYNNKEGYDNKEFY